MNPTLNRCDVWLAGLVLLCCSVSAAIGLPTDSQQELNLSSDSSSFDLKKGVTVHQGNVKLTQGSLRIDSDELIVHGNGDIIEKMIATGSPAVFEQQPELDQAPIVASGKRIEYEFKDQVETVAIVDGAKLEQGGVIHRCERIEFNLTDSNYKVTGKSCDTELPAKTTRAAPAPADGS